MSSAEQIEQVFQVSSPARLEVSNIRGLIEVQPGEDSTIRVTALKHTDTGDAERTQIEITQDADGTVRAITRYPDHIGWASGFKPCKVDYVIQAPCTCTIHLKSVSGDIRAGGFEGELSAHSVSGNVRLNHLTGALKVKAVSGDIGLEDIQGTLVVNSVSGDIRGERLAGAIRLDTTSGDVHLDQSELPSVEAGTVSGNMRIATSLGEGPYQFHSVSGDVRLVVPSETRCSAELHTLSGEISTSLPQSSHTHQHGLHLVDVQGGGVKVSLKSVSGGLRLAAAA